MKNSHLLFAISSIPAILGSFLPKSSFNRVTNGLVESFKSPQYCEWQTRNHLHEKIVKTQKFEQKFSAKTEDENFVLKTEELFKVPIKLGKELGDIEIDMNPFLKKVRVPSPPVQVRVRLTNNIEKISIIVISEFILGDLRKGRQIPFIHSEPQIRKLIKEALTKNELVDPKFAESETILLLIKKVKVGEINHGSRLLQFKLINQEYSDIQYY